MGKCRRIEHMKGLQKRLSGKSFFNKNLSTLLSREYEIIVPDTSAIIDLQQIIRESCGSQFLYDSPESFFESLRKENNFILIPESVKEEIEAHKNVRINGNSLEISSSFFNYLESLREETPRVLSSMEFGADSDQVGYNVYWTSVESCKDNSKKQEEGFSKVDRSILQFSSLVSSGRFVEGYIPEGHIREVLLMSSDAHLLRGSKFLKENWDYKLNAVDTKYDRK